MRWWRCGHGRYGGYGNKKWRGGKPVPSWLGLILALTLLPGLMVGCAGQGAGQGSSQGTGQSTVQEDGQSSGQAGEQDAGRTRAQRVRELSASDKGILLLTEKAGLSFTSYESMTSAVIPGTGADGLGIDFFTARSPYIHGDRIYYFAIGPGAITLYSMDLQAKDRIPLHKWETKTGITLDIASTYYTDGQAYVVIARQELTEGDQKSKDRTELWRVSLSDGKADLLDHLETQHGFVEQMTMVGAYDEGVCYFKRRMNGEGKGGQELSSNEDLDKAYEDIQLQMGVTPQEFSYNAFLNTLSAMELFFVPVRATTPVSIYKSEVRQSVASGTGGSSGKGSKTVDLTTASGTAFGMDLLTGQVVIFDHKTLLQMEAPGSAVKEICPFDDVYRIRMVFDGRMLVDQYGKKKLQITELSDGRSEDAPFGQLDQAGNSAFSPMVIFGDRMIGLGVSREGAEQESYYAWISLKDYLTGQVDGLHKFDRKMISTLNK